MIKVKLRFCTFSKLKQQRQESKDTSINCKGSFRSEGLSTFMLWIIDRTE